MVAKNVDRSGMINSAEISDADPEEAKLLRARAEEARRFLQSFKWCKNIRQQWFAGGFSHVAAFFFEIDNGQYPADGNLWVVVGDLPAAYLVVDVIPNYKEALLVYTYEMRRWVDEVKHRRSVKDCIPVRVEPTMEYALLLESRLDFIENRYVPSLP
jgi:hypothetical protein